MKEIEAKLKLKDSSIINHKDFIKKKEVKVLDIYFDNETLQLEKHDKVLRLRKENENTYLAFKGPREKHKDLIVREEIEPKISSFNDALKIVKNLNIKEIAKVEKIRTYFSINKYPSLSVTIDKYPFIGLFIEIEGNEKEVYQFLKDFSLDLNETIQKNCTELFLEFCENNNLSFDNPKLHFTFSDEKILLK